MVALFWTRRTHSCVGKRVLDSGPVNNLNIDGVLGVLENVSPKSCNEKVAAVNGDGAPVHLEIE